MVRPSVTATAGIVGGGSLVLGTSPLHGQWPSVGFALQAIAGALLAVSTVGLVPLADSSARRESVGRLVTGITVAYYALYALTSALSVGSAEGLVGMMSGLLHVYAIAGLAVVHLVVAVGLWTGTTLNRLAVGLFGLALPLGYVTNPTSLLYGLLGGSRLTPYDFVLVLGIAWLLVGFDLLRGTPSAAPTDAVRNAETSWLS